VGGFDKSPAGARSGGVFPASEAVADRLAVLAVESARFKEGAYTRPLFC
jgi:hypothetical protein